MKIGRNKKEKNGTCQICRKTGPLTFEHFPPKAAFNGYTYRSVSPDKLDIGNYDPRVKPQGKFMQGGIGGYTLCGNCNNFTGRHYVPEYLVWAQKGMEHFLAGSKNPTLHLPIFIMPLRVVKQVVTMFCSLNPSLTEEFPMIKKFLLNAEERAFPKEVRVFTYYSSSALVYRFIPLSMVRESDGTIYSISEISYPPFGYVLSINGLAPNEGLFEITKFTHYRLNIWVDLFLKIPVKDVVLPMSPLDYRTQKEITRAIDQSKEGDLLY